MTPKEQEKPLPSGTRWGSRDGAADAGGRPEHLTAVIACLMFCIWLRKPVRGSHPLHLSLKASQSPPSHAYVFTHTHKHIWPPAQRGPLSAVHSQGKNSHRHSGMSLSRLAVALLPQLRATHLSLFP